MTPAGLLLDTCALIWVFAGEPIAAPARAAVADAAERGALHISPISAWEIGLLAAKGRIALSMPPTRWVARALAHPGVTIAPLDPETLVESSFLPSTPPADPADRIIIATGRALGLSVVTRDSVILDYAEKGHVRATPC